ncbi:LuxR C-terminal-related transcriptional regulator [Streptomyces sp. NPDC005931]|uniref:helix-turn-helix transcriptional regulator n=1 Tax=Streptomyces sp. NPDC005931 TaxID=3364737 RepID=UPI003685D0DD
MQGERQGAEEDCSNVLIVDPDPVSRALVHRFAESGANTVSVVSAAAAADIPLDRTARPLGIFLSSDVGVRDLSLLGPLLADPSTHVILIVRSLMHGQLDTAQWVLADVVLRLEDLQRSKPDDVLSRQCRGTVAVSPEALRQVVRMASTAAEAEPRPPRLTERETETLWGVAQGLSNRQIARGMGITEHGVKRHLANAMGKLNCQNRASAVAVALRSGLLRLSDVATGVS